MSVTLNVNEQMEYLIISQPINLLNLVNTEECLFVQVTIHLHWRVCFSTNALLTYDG